jgi:predicted DNA-binding transcriptional regulator AlpA
MGLYISTPELLDRYGISKGTLINWRNNQDFPKPIIKAHGRSTSRYGIKAVDAWERNKGLLDSLEIQPLISNLS